MFHSKNSISRITALLLSATFPGSAAAFSLASIPGASMLTGTPAPKASSPAPIGKKAAAPTAVAASIPPAEIPTVPVAAKPSLVPPGDLADFGKEARQAERMQALRDRLQVLTYQKKIAALEASIKKLHVHTRSLAARPMARSARVDYAQQIVGFHHHWEALLNLNGRQFWVRPGSVTPAGTVYAIDESGVALKTGQGMLRIGLGDASAMPPMAPDGEPRKGSPKTSLSTLLSAFRPVIQVGKSGAPQVHPLPSAPARSAGEH